MLFSATLDGEVGRLAKRFTEDPVLHEVADDRATVTEATHRFIAVEQPDKMRALVRELAADRGLTLIFVRTKRGADRLARNLKQQGFKAGALHGDMSQPQRERALGHFAAGRNDVLVATEEAARLAERAPARPCRSPADPACDTGGPPAAAAHLHPPPSFAYNSRPPGASPPSGPTTPT